MGISCVPAFDRRLTGLQGMSARILSPALVAFLAACGSARNGGGPVPRPSAEMGRDKDGYPTLTLANGPLRMTLYLPDAAAGYYRGPRFDWSGLISRVEWDGHVLFSPWKDSHDPGNHDDVHGNFDGRPIGPGLRVRLTRPVKTSAFRASGAAEIRGNEIVFTRESGDFWASLVEVGPDARFEVEDPGAGFGVRVSCDLPPFKFNIWGQRRVICPEPHVALRIPPGGSQTWTIRYELYRAGG